MDAEEIDRLSGRLRVNRDKYSKYSADKLGIMRTGPSVADVAAKLSKRGSVSDTQSDSSSRRQSVDATPSLPKQSGFVPRSRKSAATDDDEPMPEIPNLLRQRSNTAAKKQVIK